MPVLFPKSSYKIMDPVSAALPQNLQRIFVATLIRRHMNVHAEKFKCHNCGKCFQSNYYLVRHHKRLGSCELILRQQRQNYNVQCPMCDFKTTSKVNLRSHLIKHTDKNQCKICKHTFLRQRDLQTHNKSPVNCNKYLMM